MGANLRTKETIVQGESEGKSFYEIIEASQTFGWRTFDSACIEAYKKGLITEEVALLYCTKRGHVSRGLDAFKKSRGEVTSDIYELRMTKGEKPDHGKPPSSAPMTYKLK
jgi:twitching motility protein PilT